MAYILGNKYAKNLCKWTVLVQRTIENVVFFETTSSCVVAGWEWEHLSGEWDRDG